ncbi:MAG: pyridoxal-phosphate dependent enzyme [Bacteroidota bacterium]
MGFSGSEKKFLIDTPIEIYDVNGFDVLVKREDMACSSPGPTFSKVRGLYPHIQKLIERGVRTVGYVETSVSMAGWGVAWACKELGLTSVIFEPIYSEEREDLELLRFHKSRWQEFGADIVPIQAGRAKINYYKAKKILMKNYKNSIMLPLGLPLRETIFETAIIAKTVNAEIDFDSVVVNVGSGTICAGVVIGIPNKKIYGIMGRTGNTKLKHFQISGKSGIGGKSGKFGFLENLELVDPGFEYTDRAPGTAPFPCHPYYDLKAWNWLVENINKFKSGRVLFWNIGSSKREEEIKNV